MVLVRVVSCGVWHEVVVMCVVLDYGLWLVSQYRENKTT